MKSMPPLRGFEFLDHPADLGFRAWAPTLAGLFAESARALTAVLVDVEVLDSRQTQRVELEGVDLVDLMFNWLSEILFLFDGTGWLCHDLHLEVDSAPDGTLNLHASLGGQPYDAGRLQLKTYVKAVTFHQLKVEEQDGMWVAQVFLDI
jgi:SHS2 domain-containing protein